jgi:hypothetical protein
MPLEAVATALGPSVVKNDALPGTDPQDGLALVISEV